MWRWHLIILLSFWQPLAAAADHVWLIGGGPDLESSQAQIEQNVIWARDVIQELPGTRRMHVYFTDGDDPAEDVKLWQFPADTALTLQPLARVFNAYWSNGESYRNHRLGKVAGGTEATALRAELESAFAELGPGDRVLLVFNGHGGFDEHDAGRNTLELWNRTALTVTDMESLLDHIHPEVSVRFLFTQCYSGAFARLARNNTNRCGFLAEAEDQPAEGCSASVEIGDYRDYSSYFFAAIAGRDRQGRPLAADPDRNRDGQISLREAHLYTLLASRSSDLPRATSEVYLERWLPWYLRWISPSGEDDNEYAELAGQVSRAQGIGRGKNAARELHDRRQALRRQREELAETQDQLSDQILALRAPIEGEVLRRWPRSRYPHTRNYQRFLEQDLAGAQAFIVAHPEYDKLVEKQNRYWELEEDLLANERALTQLEKIERLDKLAHIRDLFQGFASDGHKRRYQELLACEEQGI